MLRLLTLLLALIVSVPQSRAQNASEEPVRLAVAGLTHDHVHWILGRMDDGDVEVAGIYEANEDVRQRYAEQYDLDGDLFYTDLAAMLDAVQPEAVTAFGPIDEHRTVVEAAAPRGIHVMVEKPLAVNLEDARVMARLAREHGIHLLTNYETTWYASTEAAYDLVHREEAVGPIRKIVVRDGHRGPQEIGVSDAFLEWLTDPEQNGGGALIDFGCYGANLITWLMDGAAPLSVTAVTQQIKPDVYPDVEDEATIIVTYPEAQGIIQASWNWPIDRKDLQVYGRTGYVDAPDGEHIRVRPDGEPTAEERTLTPRTAPFDDPFRYLAAVVRGEVEVDDTDLSSLSNNMTVMRILDAALRSAETGTTVRLDAR